MTSHMRREIGQQPAAVAATLAAIAEPTAVLAAAVRERGLDRVVLVARGTSDHVAIYARYLLEARCALSASLAAPSLYTTYRPPVDLSHALVLGVSQSGQTPRSSPRWNSRRNAARSPRRSRTRPARHSPMRSRTRS